MERIDFEVLREKPTLDHYRREWRPAPNVGVAGMWMGAVLTDKAGQYYFGLRGADDFVPGMVHTVLPICGFRKLERTLDAQAPHLFDAYSTLDWFEPLEYADDGDKLTLKFLSGRIEHDADGLHWYDASGRWELHGKTISDVVCIHAPKQEGVAMEFYYRHELLMVTGHIDGIEVSGHLHLDYAYGPPGTIYSELPIARDLQGMWVSWVHEYADGRLGGGFFWQGRGALEFGPGHLLKDGVTTAHKDVVARPTVNEKGQLTALDFDIGGSNYQFDLNMAGSPIHFFGQIVQDSAGELPARSWCWVEYPEGKLSPAYLDIGVARVKLARGR